MESFGDIDLNRLSMLDRVTGMNTSENGLIALWISRNDEPVEGSAEFIAYQYKYDTTINGIVEGTVKIEGDFLFLNGEKIQTSRCHDPKEVGWGSLGADYVCESTGVFLMAQSMNLLATNKVGDNIRMGMGAFTIVGDGYEDDDMCRNDSKLGLVPCDHQQSNWYPTDGQLISTFCWGIGHSSFLSVNEGCTDLQLSTTSDGATAISRGETFMAVTQEFIETIRAPAAPTYSPTYMPTYGPTDGPV